MSKFAIITSICAYALCLSLQAHVVDIHPRSPEEDKLVDDCIQEREDEANLEILYSDDATEDEKREALVELVESGKII